MADVPDLKTASAEARSELRDYLNTRDDRRRVLPKALLVGVIAGLVAVAFRASLDVAEGGRGRILQWAHAHPGYGWIVAALFSAVGATVSLVIVRRVAPETSGSGIPHLAAVLHRHRALRWTVVLPAKFVGGVFALGSGMVLGREGPTLQMGGAVGTGVARLLKLPKREELVLTASGAGAGLAAAFNAPLSGLVFVLEELQRDFRPLVFGAAFVAAASADVVGRLFTGQLPAFSVPSYPTPDLGLLPVFALLGVVSGILGVAFNRSLVASLNAFAAIKARHSLFVGGLVGAGVGLIAYIAPTAISSGHHIAETATTGNLTLLSIPIFFVARFALTMGSYGTGAPGGIFAPLLSLGALLGLGIGNVVHLVAPSVPLEVGAFAVVGMAAYFTAIVRAPLTGIVLLVEMTQSYALMLPLLVAVFCAYATAEAFGDLPIYEALLQRDLLKGGATPLAHDEPIVLELEIEPGAPFDGKQIRELGLPQGVVLVSCREGHREWVPSAGTRLQAHTRITAVISPDSEGGLHDFREGCEKEG